MSKGRMNDLLAALQASGWRLLDANEYQRGSEDPFALVDDQIRWGLTDDDGHFIELEFHAFGDLGQPTERFSDILYCVDTATGRKLYFDKRESAVWKEMLPQFVRLVVKAEGDERGEGLT